MSKVSVYLEGLHANGRGPYPGRQSDTPLSDRSIAHMPASSSVSLMRRQTSKKSLTSAGNEKRPRPSVSLPDNALRQVSLAPDNGMPCVEPDGKLEVPDMTKDVLKDQELCASSSEQGEIPLEVGKQQLSDIIEHETADFCSEEPKFTDFGSPTFKKSVTTLVLEALNLGGRKGAGSGGASWQVSSANRKRTGLQKTVWSFLEDPELVRGGRIFEQTFSVFILVSFTLNVSQMVEDIPLNTFGVEICEVILDCLFLLEVLVRLWSSPNRIRFFVRPYNNLDIIAAVMPLALRLGTDSLVLSAASDESMSKPMMLLVCMVPILRLLKLLRHFATFHLLIMAFMDALQALPVLLYMLGVLVIFFAALIFVFESRSSIESFPQAVWFILVTISTVGYGDTVPSSLAGHLIVSVLIIISALYMAIPIGIVGQAFGRVWDNRKQLLLLHRLRVRFITAGYNVDDIPAMFCNFDVNADGQLSQTEFRDMLRQMEIEDSQGVAADIFSAFDEDGSGAVDDVEFVKALFPKTAAAIYESSEDKKEKDEDEKEETSSSKGDQAADEYRHARI